MNGVLQFQDNLSAWTQSNNSSIVVPPPKVKPNISIKFFQKRNISTQETKRRKMPYERPKTQSTTNKIAELKNLMTFLQSDKVSKYNSPTNYKQIESHQDMRTERIESKIAQTLPPKPLHIFNLKSDRNIRKQEGMKQYKQLMGFHALEVQMSKEKPKRQQSCRVDRKMSGILPAPPQQNSRVKQRRTLQYKKQTFHVSNQVDKMDDQMEKFIRTEMNCFCEFQQRKKKIEERERKLKRILK